MEGLLDWIGLGVGLEVGLGVEDSGFGIRDCVRKFKVKMSKRLNICLSVLFV